MARYYNEPASLNFDFRQSPALPTETLIPHTNDSYDLHNFLHAEHFDVIEDAIIHLRKAIWGIESTYTMINNPADPEGNINCIMELIDNLYSTITASVTSQFYYQFIRYFAKDEGVFHTFGYNPIDHAQNPDPLRAYQYDIVVQPDSVTIKPGTYLKRNRLILPVSDNVILSINDDMFGVAHDYTGSVHIYIKSSYDQNSPASVGNIVISTSALNDDGDDWYIEIYIVQRIYDEIEEIYKFDVENIIDNRTFIPEYKYELLYKSYNSEFAGIGDLPELVSPADTSIKITYSNNKYKYDLKYDANDFELDANGNLKIKSISPELITSTMNSIFDLSYFIKVEDLWQLKLSNDFTVTENGIEISSEVIAKDNFVSGLFHNGLYFDANNLLALNINYPFYIDAETDKLSLHYNATQFTINSGYLTLLYNTNTFDTTSGLAIKNNSITLSMIKYGSGVNDVKLDSDGYAVFK